MPANLRAFFELMRFGNCLMAAIAVFIGYCVSIRQLELNASVLVAMASAFFVCAGGQAINDYFDRKIDKALHPKRPIPSKRIMPGQALGFSVVLFLAGLGFSLFLPPASFFITLAFSLLLTAYSGFLARKKWLGNWVVAAGTAFTLIFGASVAGSYGIVLLLAFSALMANVARELLKDLEDLKHDRGHKVSLPMVLTHRNVQALALLFYVLGIIAVYLAFFRFGFGNFWYLLLVSLSAIVFLASASQGFAAKYSSGQSLGKKGMVIALAGYLAGVL